MLIQMSYVSSATHPMEGEQLVALLQQCLSNNAAKNITGMLLYGNSTFLQALEGEADIVDALYEKIGKDPRHTNVRSLHRAPIERRQFADWSMGFKRISAPELQQVSGMAGFTTSEFNPEYLSGHSGVADSLMSHYAYWDPLVRQVEEKDRMIKDLKAMLAQARGCVEIASVVLESVAEAGTTGSVSESHVRLCELALDSLKQLQPPPQLAAA